MSTRNAVFHGATVPGLPTAIGVVVPLWARITQLARQRGLLSRRELATALAVGGALHGAAVAHQVYSVAPTDVLDSSRAPQTCRAT
jgi:hypothetical protein